MQTVAVAGTSDRMRIGGLDAGPMTYPMNATVDQIWRVLPAALDSLGVPVSRVDPARRVIGNDGFRIRQRLRSTPLSRYLDCGQTQIGPNADSYEVYITVRIQVLAASNGAAAGATVATTFQASARPLTFPQAYSACSTRGALENRLAELVRAQLR